MFKDAVWNGQWFNGSSYYVEFKIVMLSKIIPSYSWGLMHTALGKQQIKFLAGSIQGIGQVWLPLPVTYHLTAHDYHHTPCNDQGNKNIGICLSLVLQVVVCSVSILDYCIS